MICLTKIIAIVLLFVTSASTRGTVPSCPDIMNRLTPCISHLLQGWQSRPACCNGVQYLTKYSNGREDRRAICGCIKGAANMMGSIDFSLISDLPSKCGVCVNLPPISRNIDCSQ
ncbi:hypothetical protein C1H46_021106 [Malus baccata]|uniref:Non-specific lipid-transfer protein n=1 Tax=Malus baccata TaxID=106549 RepID=A0A540M3G3_MALBA|nr:hypothetical protein C1H46_021106 [Malus baccata]